MTRAIPLDEVAESLGVSLRTVGEWIAKYELKAVNLSRSGTSRKPRFRVLESDLQEFLRSRSTAPDKPPTRRRRAVGIEIERIV